MNYYITETEKFISGTLSEQQRMTASSKPRVDIDRICAEMLDRAIPCPFPQQRKGYIRKFLSYRADIKEWKRRLAPLTKSDVLFLQYPLPKFNIFQNKIFKRLRKKGVRVIALVHDMDWLRLDMGSMKTRARVKIQRKALRYFDTIVVHNQAMKETLGDLRANIVCLGIFDYLSDETKFGKRGLELPVIIAGNLSPEKAGYAYHLPQDVAWNLYGPYYAAQSENVNYRGAFPSEQLPSMMDGSFGLVWDGDSADTCGGSWGNYLRYNNPYKTSLYLACGLPVIIWKEAALAEFVLKNDCGIAVGSLFEVESAISGMSEERYAELCRGAERVGAMLREGTFTRQALRTAFFNEVKDEKV